MTNERAKSELEQLYMSLSEEKKKALDVAFKAMAQALPVMYYAQVDGITPTVVAQADGEKNCFNCKWYPDNDITKGFDEVCHKCSNSDKWEGLIKRVPWEDIAPPPKIPEAQADGEYILKSEAIRVASGYCHPSNIAKELEKLPSVAIPSAEPYKGMTNGEVIKAMFGDDKVSEFMGYARIMARVGNWFNDGVVAEFDKDWWNSPYEPQERSDKNDL